MQFLTSEQKTHETFTSLNIRTAPHWQWGWFAALGASLVLVYCLSIIARVALSTDYRAPLTGICQWLIEPASRLIIESIVLVITTCLFALKFPSRLIRRFNELARMRKQAILFAALLPITVRIVLLPLAPVPIPKVADEFGHLLVADTIAAGRLANPSHKLWTHFETLYVLQEPSYVSIYPIAQGFTMAAAKIAGLDPWFGVCASIGLLCGVLCWMLQGWLPEPWALLGAVVAASRLAIDSYWMNSYWGGAVAATGGALVLGALPRLLQRKRTVYVIPMATGLAILSQSRPFEGVLLSAPVCAWILIAALRERAGERRQLVGRVILPLACAGLAIVAVTLYYNWRVSKTILFPYQLHQQIYGTPQNFRWAPEVNDAPRANIHKDIADNFEWQRSTYRKQATGAGLWTRTTEKIESFWRFFVGPSLTIPLLLFGITGPRRGLFAITLFVVLAAAVLYPFFFPHYAAPVAGAVLAATVFGLSRLHEFQWRGRSIGARLAPALVSGSIASAVICGFGWSICTASYADSTPRSIIESKLSALGGSHLIFVRYGPNHDFHHSWIYNAADVDRSSIVWARDMGAEANKELESYFSNRRTWLAEVDDPGSLLIPYADAERPRISSIVNAAGVSPFFKGGVTPGSMVMIKGRNLITEALEDVSPGTLSCLFHKERCRLPAADYGGTLVEFGGTTATILGASRNGTTESLTVMVPADYKDVEIELTVTRKGLKRTVTVPVQPANPGIFENSSSAILLRPDDSVVSAQNPARRGETIRCLTTGVGRDAAASLVMGVNHRGATVRGVQRGPVLAGVDVISFDVPADAPSGEHVPLSLAVVIDGAPVYSNNSSIAIE